MPAACRAASAAPMRRGVDRQPRLSSHPCHARRRAPCAPVGALAVLHQPARRGAMHPGHCVGRQPACLSTEQERMLRTLAQHQLASNQALSPLHSRPRAPAAALLNAQAQEPPLVVAALCSAACEQRSARQTRGTPGRLWDGGPPSECEPHRRPCLPQPRASSSKRQHRACFSETFSIDSASVLFFLPFLYALHIASIPSRVSTILKLAQQRNRSRSRRSIISLTHFARCPLSPLPPA